VRGLLLKLKKSHIPLYYQLEQILRESIRSREFDPDAPLPTEQQLCKTYGVSRAVVRQALESLIQDGLIARVQGKGTFLTNGRSTRRILHYFHTIEDLVELSEEVQNEIMFRGWVVPTGGTASLFDLASGQHIYSLRGTRRLNDLPVCYFIIEVPPEFASLFDGETVQTGAFLTVLERKSGLVVVRVRQIVEAARAGKEAAIALNIDEDAPVLVFKRVYYLENERAVEVATSYFHADHNRYVMEFSRKGRSVRG